MDINKKVRSVCQFAIDDFKTKYAGSFFGALWAFAQPIITVVIYWFIFQIGFKNEPVRGVPFIVWLVTGLLPWFFIGDVLPNATVSFVEYKYLVKKVLFNIDILPLAKVVSNIMIQMVLIVMSLLVALIYGVRPSIHWFQIIYYMIYMIVFCSGASYLLASFYVFFKDTLQLVSVVLQILFWTTPIVWNITIMPERIQKILSFNPVYYVVNGYRDSIAFQGSIFDVSIGMTIYYWCIAILMLFLGRLVMKRLKPLFADVL